MTVWVLIFAAAALSIASTAQADGSLGLFSDHTDTGAPTPAGKGSAAYRADDQSYNISGTGKNMWFGEDAFHFVWKKVPAGSNLSLAATIELAPATAGADPHRKALVMIRQSLDADSPYADACVHGNGLTGIQWRDAKGALTFGTQAQADGPKRIRIEKRGDYLSMSFGSTDDDLQPVGGACKVPLSGDFYIGLGVCPHDVTRVESARFSDVVIQPLDPIVPGKTRMISTLETLQLASKDRRAVCSITLPGIQRAEAPNWSADGTLYFNSQGKLFKIKADVPDPKPPTTAAPAPQQIDLGPLTNINNDHAISPDGKWMAVSDQSGANHQSVIWLVPIGGVSAGQPRRVTEKSPSYFHGWSPDGKRLAYCAQRDGNFDIYTISVDGGVEQRLTDSTGKDDGPEYSPDGQHIYFNSDRTGSMQVWRMKVDGSEQERLTHDDRNNWFPHLSPDGLQFIYIAYEPGVADHPENKDVELRLMNLQTRQITPLAKVFGGQGTMNVPSWSPDGKHVAFVSFQMVPE